MLQRRNTTALKLAKHFYFGNYSLTLMVVAIFMILNILQSFLGPLGLLFYGAFLILTYSVQVYYASYIPTIRDPEEMEDIARGTALSDLLFSRIAEGAAFFLAFLVINAIFGLFIYLVLTAYVGDDLVELQRISAALETAGPEERQALQSRLIEIILTPALIVLAVGSFFSYVAIGVWGRMLKAQGFVEAFKRSFLLFWPKYWVKTFKLRYMLLVGGWILFILLFLFLTWLAFMAIGFLFAAALHNYPELLAIVMFIFSTLVIHMVMYYLDLYSAGVAVFADDIASGEADG